MAVSDDRCPLCGGSIRHPMCPAIEHGREVPWTLALLAIGMIAALTLSLFASPASIVLIITSVLATLIIAWIVKGLRK